MATGGGGAIYGRTDNPPRMTGDGYHLLARAGAVLEDFARGSFPPSFDPFGRPVRIAPTQHYFCGGAVITKAGEVLGRDRAPIPGLFACGEVTAGVDGANRVGGNALTNIVVFGLAAGRAAARYAAGAANRGWAAGDGVTAASPLAASASLAAGAPSAGADRPADLRRELQTLCDDHLGPVRSAPRLEEAPAVATATYVARAALARTESRGAHFREDYPTEEEAWSPRHVAL